MLHTGYSGLNFVAAFFEPFSKNLVVSYILKLLKINL